MSRDLNISVLVAARDEYIEQLKYILIPLIIQGFNSVYSDALRICEGKFVIMKFQDLLEEILHWNQTILQEEAKRIKKKCPFIMNIVTAIFVSSVKILASVRLKGKNDNINIKIPTSDIFIHSIYLEAAQQIWYDPFLFYHKNHAKKPPMQVCKQSIINIISDSIDRSFRQMLPLDDILQEYLANALNDDADSEDLESDVDLNGKDIISESEGSEDEYSNDSDSDSGSDIELNEPVKTFNFNNPPGQQYQPEITQPLPPLNNFGQATTFDDLNQNNVPVGNVVRQNEDDGYSSDSSSSSGSSSSSSSSSGSDRHRDRHQPQQVQQPQQQFQQQQQQPQNKGNYSFF